jgi:DNA-directed RNA polymerase subunit omega
MSEKLEGIVSPSIDKLMDRVDSKYELVMFAAKRARQINDYYSALH